MNKTITLNAEIIFDDPIDDDKFTSRAGWVEHACDLLEQKGFTVSRPLLYPETPIIIFFPHEKEN